MGAIGGVLRATSGPPSVSTVSSVKNPALQANIDQAIGGYGNLASQGDAAYNAYLANWNAGQPAAAARTGQELGAINQFYTGGMSNQLAQLRAARASAMTNAANVASQQAIRAMNASRVTGQGGLSSYNQRLAMANLTPIRVQAALDDANQARSDLGYVTQNQVGLAGQRQNLANQLAGYGLVPTQQRLAMLQGRAGYLGQLGNLDQQNKFYGLQQKPNMWADVADSLDQGILNAAAIYGSIGAPGMGGGKGMSRGGVVRGPGTGTSDSIRVRLSRGEFVVPADVVKIPGILPLLERMRHMHEMHYVGKHQEALKTEIKSKRESGRGMSRGGKVMGYADGGLAGSAQQLGARAMADLTPTWMPPVILGEDSSASRWGTETPLPRRVGMGAGASMMPRSQSMASPYFHPSNMSDISPEWQAYGRRTADYYSNPTSPGYIAPGTYE